MKKTDAIKYMLESLRPRGDYSKTDIQNYSELSSGKIRAALLTKNQQEMFSVFSLIEDKDSSVGAECEKRISSITNKFFTHSLGEDENENIEELIKASVEARVFGFGLIELYLKDDASLGVSKVDREFIRFEENKPHLNVKGKDIVAKPPFYLSITAKPVLLKVLWIVYAKHYVLSQYLKFTEFLGVPPLIGNSASGDEKVISLMAEAFKNLRSGSYGVFGPNDTVKVLEGRGSQADFMEFVRYCDGEIAKVINGSVLSSNVSSTGSFAMSKVHDYNRKEILAGDVKFAAREVQNFYKTFGKKADLNIQIEKDSDLLQRAQVLSILHPMGYQMSPKDMAKEFDLPEPVKNSNFRNSPNSNLERNNNLDCASNLSPLGGCRECNSRSQGGLGSPEKLKFLDEIDKAAFGANTKDEEVQIEKAIMDIVKNADSFEEVYENMLQAFPSAGIDAIEDTLEKIIANAHIKGML